MTATAEIILNIEAKGEIVSSNFPAFADMVRARLGEINRELATDDDFDQADQDAKAIAGAEASLKSAKEKALADAEQLHALFEGIDGLSAELAAARLDLAGQIRKRKEELKNEIVEEFLAAFDIDPRDARKHFLKGLQESIKGKRTVESMRTSCRIYQTTQQARITEARATIAKFEAKFGPDLTMDRRELELKGNDAVEAELVRRHEAKAANEEKAKLQKLADEAKAEAAKLKVEIAEAGKPPAPPENVEQGPWKAEAPAMTEDDELKAFRAVCLAAFAQIKYAKEKLTYSKNIAKAQGFGNVVNTGWREWL